MDNLPEQPAPPPATPGARPIWHWFVLLTPAVEILAVCWLIDQSFSGENQIGPLFINLGVFVLLSLGLGIWWMWRHPSMAGRILIGCLVGGGIAVVNGLIAAAGCSMGLMK